MIGTADGRQTRLDDFLLEPGMTQEWLAVWMGSLYAVAIQEFYTGLYVSGKSISRKLWMQKIC